MIAFTGQKKVGPRPDWSLLGEYPRPFHMRVSRALTLFTIKSVRFATLFKTRDLLSQL